MTGLRTVGARRMAYQPALDGVRAIAVALVLCFHAGFGWMPGGYVGVSVFFTLSGFLITSLALVEHERTGRLDVGAFYARRLRRLLPASLLCVIGVVIAARLGAFDGAEDLRRDMGAAVAQVFNWVALAGDTSYADVVGAGGARLNPLDHYWSLAIEEQFYWVWPLVLVAVLRWSRPVRTAVVGALIITAAVAAPLIAWHWGPDAAYWATPARLAEILLGAGAAVVIDHHRSVGRDLPAWVPGLAPAGLVTIVAVAATWPSGSGPAYAGWLPVFALASVALIVGLQVDGAVRRLLSVAPLAALGMISYGVYLVHWPVYGILDEQRTGFDRMPLFVLRVAVTLVVAAASYALVERRVRRTRAGFRPTLVGGLASCAAVGLVAMVVPVERPGYWVGSAAAETAVAIEPVDSLAPLDVAAGGGDGEGASGSPPMPTEPQATSPPTSPPSGAPVAAPAVIGLGEPVPALPPTLSRPARILLVGDSTLSAAGAGMVQWAADHPDLARVSLVWSIGCGFVRDGHEAIVYMAQIEEECARTLGDVPVNVNNLQPDVVVLMQTVADVVERSFDDGRPNIQPGDSGFDDFLIGQYESYLADLRSQGVRRVAWVIPPPQIRPDTEELIVPLGPAAMRTAIETVAARHPDVVTVIDLEAWQATRPGSLRPDGLHYSPDGAGVLADALLGPSLVALALS